MKSEAPENIKLLRRKKREKVVRVILMKYDSQKSMKLVCKAITGKVSKSHFSKIRGTKKHETGKAKKRQGRVISLKSEPQKSMNLLW